MITFVCSQCNTQHSVPDEWAGKSAQCPCGMKLTVPKIVKLDPAPQDSETPQESENDPSESEENENDFNFDPNALSSIPSATRKYTRRRKPWWVPLAKYLSAAAAAMLLFLCYPYYAPKLDDFFASWKGEQTTTEAPSDLANNTSAPQKKSSPNTNQKRSSKTVAKKSATKKIADEETNNLKIARDEEVNNSGVPTLETLEKAKRRQKQPAPPEVPEVTLPSGRTISVQRLSLPEATEVAVLKIPDTEHYYHENTNGEICAVCQYNPGSRKIEGLNLRVHSNGTASSLATLDNQSKRNGPLYCWNEEGRLCYYCDWTHGRKQGISCLFDQEKPVFIQEWKANRPLAHYRVRYRNDNDLKPELEKIKDLGDPKIASWKEQIVGLERDLDKSDAKLRRRFVIDLKKRSNEIRIATNSNNTRALASVSDLNYEEELKDQSARTTFWQAVTAGPPWSGKQRWLAPKAEPAKKKR